MNSEIWYLNSKHGKVLFTSFGVSLYSFTLSTATMLVSRSEDILTSQVREAVSFMSNRAKSQGLNKTLWHS